MKVITVAKNTLKENIRNKVYYIFLIFALSMIFGSILLADLSMGAQIKIIKDMGLSVIAVFGVLTALFLGMNLLYKEVDKKIIFNVLSKPVARWQFILGKYLGLLFSLFFLIFIMTLGLMFLIFLYEGRWEPLILLSSAMIFVELMIITAFVLMFSTFSSPVLSGFFTFFIYILGHLSFDLKVLSESANGLFTSSILRYLYYVIPNLNNFDIKSKVAGGIVPDLEYIKLSLSYGAIYISILLLISIAIYSRKDFV